MAEDLVAINARVIELASRAQQGNSITDSGRAVQVERCQMHLRRLE